MISSFLLVPAVVPGLVSLRVSLLVSSFLAQKRNLFHHYFLLLAGSGSVSGAGVPSCLFFLCSQKKAVPSWEPASCWFRLWFWLWFGGLSPFLSPFLSLLSLLQKAVCFIMTSSFLLVPALVLGLVSLLVCFLSSLKRSLFYHDFVLFAGSGSGSGFGFQTMNMELRMTFLETWILAVWGLCWRNFGGLSWVVDVPDMLCGWKFLEVDVPDKFWDLSTSFQKSLCVWYWLVDVAHNLVLAAWCAWYLRFRPQ